MKRSRTKGVSTLAVIALLVVAGIGYVGWNSYQKSQARAAHEAAVASANASMDKMKVQWLDALRLATSTPRLGMAGPISSLQAIRQNAQQLEVPECLTPNKQNLVTGMNEALEGVLAFMRNDMGKYDLEEFTLKKITAMNDRFLEFEKKPVPCLAKKT
ncbi:MAG: hypothetical protein LWW96_13530 [Acidovorax sp.]|uniref:hypothetical protein n=1 Tax=Acidovorax sp. TaxID=1872122 RepID=UPI0025C3C023|nr:hypothetical protein [Acidovorax sp.]MCE1193163.1 hypothetical protein [Acidovorax sp.]